MLYKYSRVYFCIVLLAIVGQVFAQQSGYVGCFRDDRVERDFQRKLPNSNSNSISRCKANCKAAGFSYAGLQGGIECYCSNNYGSYGKVSDSECSRACPGANSERCGGNLRNSIYLSDGPIKSGANVGVCNTVLVVDRSIINAFRTLTPTQRRSRYAKFFADVDSHYQNHFNLRLPLIHYAEDTNGILGTSTEATAILPLFQRAIAEKRFPGMPEGACVYHLIHARDLGGVLGLASLNTACGAGGINRGYSRDVSLPPFNDKDRFVRVMIHEIGHHFNGNHPDFYLNANPAYSSCKVNEFGNLQILRNAPTEEKEVDQSGSDIPCDFNEIELSISANDSSESHHKRAISRLAYHSLNPGARISGCASLAISNSLSSFQCLWKSAVQPSAVWYDSTNKQGRSVRIDAHKGKTCYNLNQFSNIASSHNTVGSPNGLIAYKFQDCRGSGVRVPASSNNLGDFAGLNDNIESFRFA